MEFDIRKMKNFSKMNQNKKPKCYFNYMMNKTTNKCYFIGEFNCMQNKTNKIS